MKDKMIENCHKSMEAKVGMPRNDEASPNSIKSGREGILAPSDPLEKPTRSGAYTHKQVKLTHTRNKNKYNLCWCLKPISTMVFMIM